MSEILCPNATKTKVTITFGDNSVKKIEFNSGSISVSKKDEFIADNNSPIKCWKFSDSLGSFEWFGCGEIAQWRDVGATPANSSYWIGSTRQMQPFLDDVRLCGANDYVGNSYINSPQIITNFPINRLASAGSYGSCGSCSSDSIKYHEYTFTDTNNNVIKVRGLAESKLVSGCDDGCPEGQIKCECDEYPGYCCIPCEEIKQGIKDATNQLRSKANGV